MKIQTTHRSGSLCAFLALCLAACGGGAPPSSATAAAGAPPPSAAPGAPPAAASAEPAAAPPSPSASPEPAKTPAPAAESAPPGKSMSDRLFAPTLAYMLNYSASGAREKVLAACAAKSGDDLGAKAACADKEREKLSADVLVFEKKNKVASLTIYKRTGNSLAELCTAQVEVAKDSPESIELKITSEKGFRQLFAGRKQLVLSSSSDSSIAIDDPQLGQLVYEARIGLVNPATAK